MKKEKHIYFKFFFVFLFLLGFLKSNYSQEKAKVSGPREKTYKEEYLIILFQFDLYYFMNVYNTVQYV